MDRKDFELGGRGRGGGREKGMESCLCWASVNGIVDTTVQVFLPFVLSALVSRVPELKRAVGLGEKGVQRGVEKVAVVFWVCAVPSLGIGLTDGGFKLVPLLLGEEVLLLGVKFSKCCAPLGPEVKDLSPHDLDEF